MAEGAGARLLQQNGQDLASWKRFSYIYCARGGPEILAVPHISSTTRRGGHVVGSEQI